jgi:predicted alpha/beta superfamily hydrolase
MKNIWLCILIIFIPFVSAQQKGNVSFVLHSPTLTEEASVYITGSIDELGNWSPDKVKMEYAGDNKWMKVITITVPNPLEYKFTLGSWDKEGADSSGFPLHNFNSVISGDTTILVTINNWTNGIKKNLKGQITGTVKYHRNLEGEGILPRDVIVWLPPGYESDTISYPVLYMHDGQNIFDPATSSFGIDWQIDESIDSLVKSGKIPGVIAVGIYNTSDRTEEYTNTPLAQAYMDFITGVLKPMIDSEYRTLKGPENTITGGASAAGLAAFLLVWEHPEVFSRAICMSPSFRIGNIDYVSVVEQTEKRKDVFFYIDNGGKGVDIRLQPGVDDMLNALKQKGYTEGKDYFFISDPEAEHFESSWAKRFPDALMKCLERK